MRPHITARAASKTIDNKQQYFFSPNVLILPALQMVFDRRLQTSERFGERLLWATDVYAHIARAAFAKHLAVVERQTGLIFK